MVFDFDKIENTDIGVSPVIPLLFKNNRIKNDSDEMNLCFVYMTSLKEVLNRYIKKESILNDLLNIGKKTKPLCKSETIIQKNVILKLKRFVDSLLAKKGIVVEKNSVYEYIIESIFVIENVIVIKDKEYLVNLLYTYNYLYKRSKNLVFDKMYTMLKKSVSSNYNSNFKVMCKFPHLSHSQNLICLSDNFSRVKLFQHQIDFIDIINSECDKKLLVINASPIGSGKSILQTYTCLNSHYKNIHSLRIRNLLVVTCKNKFVIEEIARGCNVENKIGYWFFYHSKLIPSLFCHPISKKGYRFIVQKPISEDMETIEDEYEYYLNQSIQISSSSKYQKKFCLPDVIFCHSDDVCELLDSSFAEKYVKSIVIDEFLIPGFERTLSSIFEKNFIKKYILLSASAPSSLEKLFEKKCLPTSVLENKDKYTFRYLYEEIVPSFIRCFCNCNETWVPTMNVKRIEDIENFSWYHFRFYSPFVILEMKEYLNCHFDLSMYHESLNFLSIEEMFQVSKSFLFSLCEDKSPEFLRRVRSFRPSTSIQGRVNGDEKWMIVSKSPIETLLSKCSNIDKDVNIKDVIDDITLQIEKIRCEKEDLLKKLTSLKKSKNMDKEDSFIENQEVQDQIQQLDKNILRCSSYSNNVISSFVNYNKIHVEDLKKMFGELMISIKDETKVSKIIILAIHGYICVSDISRHYFKITQQPSFFTKRIFVSKDMCYGTDMNIYGVKLEEDMDVDSITLVQGLGRAGRNRKHIEVPVFSSLSSLERM